MERDETKQKKQYSGEYFLWFLRNANVESIENKKQNDAWDEYQNASSSSSSEEEEEEEESKNTTYTY